MRLVARLVLLAGVLLVGAGTLAAAVDEYAAARQRLMEEVAALMAQTSAETGRSALSPRVAAALGSVPRHRYVPPDQQHAAYENRPLPIGYGQSISQPYVVALMTELMQVSAGDKVLEVGTGSGYQAAILAQLGAAVFTIEIIEPLARGAAATLRAEGLERVQVKTGDGYYGWDEHAPFDAIIVTAAASHVPPPLIRQLKPGGRMVIPLGTAFMTQNLMLIEKDAEGRVLSRAILPVRFVPLTGAH